MWDVTGGVCGTQWVGGVGHDGQGVMVGCVGRNGQGVWDGGTERVAVAWREWQ